MKIIDESKLKLSGQEVKDIKEIARDWIGIKGLSPSQIIKEIKHKYGIELNVVDLIKIAL